MRVNVAVCGIFHYRKYIGELSRLGVLEAFYFSHKRSTNAQSLGLPEGTAFNLYLKEYLLRAVQKMKVFGEAEPIHPLFHDLWQRQLISRWKPCDLFHVMLHGTARKALAMCQQRGIKTLGEPVMSHPKRLQALLEQEHDSLGLPKPPPMNRQFRRLIEEAGRCDYLISASRFVRDSFIAEGFPADRALVLPYAVDLTRFYPLDDAEKSRVNDGKFRVICVAQITARKGHQYLLEAWKRLGLKSSEAELVLIGLIKDDIKPVLAKYDGLFTYKSPMPHDALRMEYGRSSVFVLPSVEDGFGYVTTEAMGCGLPVITTRNAGSADVVEDGGSGFVVDARSADALAEKIELLYRDANLRTAMGRRAEELSRTSLSWKQYAENLSAIYGQILGKTSAAG